MTTLVGKSFNAYLGDMIQVSNSGTGIDGTLRAISSWTGTASSLLVSTAAVQAANISFNGNTISTSTSSLTLNSSNGSLNFGTQSGSAVVIGNSTGTTAINGTVSFGTALSFSNLHLTGNLTVDGTSTLTGNVSLGGTFTLNAHTLTLTATASLGGTSSGTNTGDQTIILTGDVTGTGTGSFAATIGSNKVTYGKMQQTVGTSVLIGNTSGSAGNVSEQTISAAAVSGLLALNTVIQKKYTQTTSIINDTTHIPVSTSAPTSSQGSQALSLAITPTNSSNILTIEGNIQLGSSSVDQVTIALFQDSNATATFCNTSLCGTSNAVNIPFKYIIVAGTTSATTFKIRFGAVSASTAVNGINGTGNTQGGTWVTGMTITETTP